MFFPFFLLLAHILSLHPPPPLGSSHLRTTTSHSLGLVGNIQTILNDLCRARPSDPYAFVLNRLSNGCIPATIHSLESKLVFGADTKIVAEVGLNCMYEARITPAGTSRMTPGKLGARVSYPSCSLLPSFAFCVVLPLHRLSNFVKSSVNDAIRSPSLQSTRHLFQRQPPTSLPLSLSPSLPLTLSHTLSPTHSFYSQNAP